jgi:hypothetical protein
MPVSDRIGGRWFCLIVMGLVAVCCSSCVGVGAIHSQVLDAQTKQPIAGAVVLGVWTKKTTFGFSTKLVGVKETVTDAEGRFTLARPGSLFADDESVTVYKFGYVAWNNQTTFLPPKSRKEEAIPAHVFLEMFPPVANHTRHINFINSVTRGSLISLEDSPKLYKELEKEMRLRELVPGTNEELSSGIR